MTGKYARTGIQGLDDILEGKGIPEGYTVLVAGGPGSGKTTFGIQFLYNGTTQYDEPGLYISVDESPEHIRADMMRFGFDLEELERKEKFAFFDISPIRYMPTSEAFIYIGKKDFPLNRFREEVIRLISKIKAKRAVIDPISIFTLQYPDETARRYAIIDMIQTLAVTGVTTLLISELRGTSMDREHQFEEYLSQGVILLRTLALQDKLVRAIQIAKMRRLNHDMEPRPYKITSGGIEVYPQERVL